MKTFLVCFDYGNGIYGSNMIMANTGNKELEAATETAEEFMDIIEKLLKMSGLDIELCGSWLWIGGNTREHKDALNAAGCRWSNNKKLWYWRHEEDGHRWHKGKKTMADICATYGSQHISGKHYSRYESLDRATA